MEYSLVGLMDCQSASSLAVKMDCKMVASKVKTMVRFAVEHSVFHLGGQWVDGLASHSAKSMASWSVGRWDMKRDDLLGERLVAWMVDVMALFSVVSMDVKLVGLSGVSEAVEWVDDWVVWMDAKWVASSGDG